jgi:hypothetical protein
MIEVFKTNVSKTRQATKIIGLLQINFPDSTINFDLSDCDKVLRIESQRITPDEVIKTLTSNGFSCEELE